MTVQKIRRTDVSSDPNHDGYAPADLTHKSIIKATKQELSAMPVI